MLLLGPQLRELARALELRGPGPVELREELPRRVDGDARGLGVARAVARGEAERHGLVGQILLPRVPHEHDDGRRRRRLGPLLGDDAELADHGAARARLAPRERPAHGDGPLVERDLARLQRQGDGAVRRVLAQRRRARELLEQEVARARVLAGQDLVRRAARLDGPVAERVGDEADQVHEEAHALRARLRRRLAPSVLRAHHRAPARRARPEADVAAARRRAAGVVVTGGLAEQPRAEARGRAHGHEDAVDELHGRLREHAAAEERGHDDGPQEPLRLGDGRRQLGVVDDDLVPLHGGPPLRTSAAFVG